MQNQGEQNKVDNLDIVANRLHIVRVQAHQGQEPPGILLMVGQGQAPPGVHLTKDGQFSMLITERAHHGLNIHQG